MSIYTTLENKEGIGVITFTNPPVNALSSYAVAELLPCFEKALADTSIKAIILIGGNNTFIGGADITEFGKNKDQITDIFKTLDDFDGKPIVAAIEKYAFGGGLEVAFSCHFRIASKTAKVGFPEVHLGLLPGGRGTQKLPRIAGVEIALQMMMTGNPVNALEAKERRIIDEISQNNLLDDALSFTKKILENNTVLQKPLSLPCENKPEIIKVARKLAKIKQRGFCAPQAIINCVEAAATKPVEEGLKVEQNEFKKLIASKESQAQIYAFFSEKQTNKIPFLAADTLPFPINSAAVYGLGNMGNGIAMNFATAGIPVKVFEKDKDNLKKGYTRIKENYLATHKKGSLSKEKMDAYISLITPCEDMKALKGVDILIEAVYEDMDLKKKLFAEFEKYTDEKTLLVSNTSALDIDAIASATKRPDKVCGMHFFNPANKMRVLEVVKGKASSGATLKIVAEGSGENIFLIKNNRIFSPPSSDGALEGITADTIKTFINDLGLSFQERHITKEDLLDADELFFTGTAAELTPICSVDNIPIGSGKKGPISHQLQKHYFETLSGKQPAYLNWLDFV